MNIVAQYGAQIGKKFEADGTARRYPGNTVIADVRPGCGAYAVLQRLRERTLEEGFGGSLILLPQDSYHMTVLRGLNDQVRTSAFWPNALPKNAPMREADDYVASAVASVKMPGPIRMQFAGVRVDAEDFRVQLEPADKAQKQILQDFRDEAAARIGLYLPGHESYTYHITLAYTRLILEGEQMRHMEALTAWMRTYIAQQPVFETTAPYMAYYDDMLSFSARRIAREA